MRVGRRGGEPGGRAGAAIDARAGVAGGRGARTGRARLVRGREEWMARFVNAQVPEVVQPFWAALQRGEFIADAAVAGGHVSQAGHALGGGLRRRAPAPRPRPEGPLPVVRRARGDRARARARRDDARDRAAPGPVAVDDLARAAPQRRPRRRLPGDDRARAGLSSARAARSRPSWPPTSRCARSCRTISGGASRPSRSPGGCAAGSPTSRRCGCPPRRSISRSTCSRAARSSAS